MNKTLALIDYEKRLNDLGCTDITYACIDEIMKFRKKNARTYDDKADLDTLNNYRYMVYSDCGEDLCNLLYYTDNNHYDNEDFTPELSDTISSRIETEARDRAYMEFYPIDDITWNAISDAAKVEMTKEEASKAREKSLIERFTKTKWIDTFIIAANALIRDQTDRDSINPKIIPSADMERFHEIVDNAVEKDLTLKEIDRDIEDLAASIENEHMPSPEDIHALWHETMEKERDDRDTELDDTEIE